MNCDICKKELLNNKYIKAFNKILCPKHYQQMLKYGHIIDTNPKSTKDLNDFEITEEGIWIITYNRKCEESGRFLIDNDKYSEEILKHKWRLWKNRFYTGNFEPQSIHNFVLKLSGANISENSVIDHINHNPADNRKCNLRICTQGQNTINKSKQSTNTSGFAGIRYNEKRKSWEIEIRFQYKRIHFTRQKHLEDAIYIRYIAEQILFKDFRNKEYDEKIKPYIDKCNRKSELENYVKLKISQTYNI